MYLVTIHVPIYVRGGERLLATDWKRSLLLLRDSFDGRFGRLQVVAPSLDALTVKADQPLEAVRPDDELDLFPSFPLNTRAREFWTRHIHTWRRDVAALLPQADIVHAGFCDVYRPINFIGFLQAVAADKPTVFVQDTDQVLQMSELMVGEPLRKRIKDRAYCELYERSVRVGVAKASLSLLKGRALHARYGRYAKNAKNFHDTSFLSSEVVSPDKLDRRVADMLQDKRPLRLVYCGRLEARKGLDESLDAIMRARAQGARVTLDIIGDGTERAALERQSVGLKAEGAVKFLGSRVYGPELLADLATYDALFFTPVAEDTPRMIFDGYAAGLPLLGYGIDYVREREAEDGAARSVPVRDASAAASMLTALDRDRHALANLTKRAREAALYHAADAWYRRRAEWTYEAASSFRPVR
ncbi:MAG TPA: glycosyltransferase [Polyangiales bacterium]|nr:glycosyltransferase [Polyangiales bacterium]